MRKGINENASHPVMFYVDLFLIRCEIFLVSHHSNTIDLNVNAIFQDILQLIVKTYDVSVHLALPPFKFSRFSTRYWRSSNIIVLIRYTLIMVIITTRSTPTRTTKASYFKTIMHDVRCIFLRIFYAPLLSVLGQTLL